MRHKRRKKLVPAIAAGSLVVAGIAAGITSAAQATNAPSGTQNCVSSWYGATDENVEGAATASGEPFRVAKMTAASRDLPLGTVVKVKDKKSGRSVNVKINDRGPFMDPEHRCIDITGGAYFKLGEDLCGGTIDVSVKVMPPGTKTSRPDPQFKPISMSDCVPGAPGAAQS